MDQFNLPKIEKGIPVPSTNKALKTLVTNMAIGDSVYVKTRSHANQIVHSLRTIGSSGMSRKEGDGFRVWKVQKE